MHARLAGDYLHQIQLLLMVQGLLPLGDTDHLLDGLIIHFSKLLINAAVEVTHLLRRIPFLQFALPPSFDDLVHVNMLHFIDIF